ncbi:hypothetical protein V498_02250, partial [Pseudogymnoascus sp. VKM F-4517 (FW-2822)]
RLLEETCFDFAKTWFSSDHRVQEWTSPAQVEISKWRDLLGTARIPYDALDGNVQTPLRVLLQEATHIRNNAVHRSQVPADDILKMLTSSMQLARMLRDETRLAKIEDIRGRLIYELHSRDNNRVRAAVGYRKARDDIDRRKDHVYKKLDELHDEEDHAVSVFEKDSAVYDKMLQSSVIRFVNEVIHTGEEVARVAPAAYSTPKPLPIAKNSTAATDGKSEGGQGRNDEDVQFISKSDFEVATSGSRRPRKEPARDARPGSKDKEISFKQDQDHPEDVLSIIRPPPSAAKLLEVQSTPGSRNRGNSSCVGVGVTIKSISNGATPRILSVVKSGTGINMDSPSRQLELEAKMANSIRELSIDEYDILENLDAELDNQLVSTMLEARVSVDSVLDQMNRNVKPSVEEPVSDFTASSNSNGQDDPQSNRSCTEPCALGRRVQSSELKMTDRSSAPAPDVEMSGADPSNAVTANTTDDATTVGLPVVEFGKPWKPTTTGPTSITRAVCSQGGVLRTGAGSQVTDPEQRSVSVIRVEKSQKKILQAIAELPAKPSVQIFEDGKSKQVNLSTMHLWRKRKADSPLTERTSASCNSMMSTRAHTRPAFGNPGFSTGVALNGSGILSTTSIAGLPMITSFGDVARLAKDVGFNPKSSAVFTGVDQMNAFQMGKPQETPATDVYTSRQAATWERRRILVGCLSFTPSKEEVEKLFLGYSVTRIDFPEMWIMETKTKPSGCVFVDLATASQAKLALQKLCGNDPKIRNCKVSIMLATDPWKGANAPRRILSAIAKNKKRTTHISGATETKRKSEPIGKRTRSYYAAAREKALADDQSSKRQKMITDASKETTGLGGN